MPSPTALARHLACRHLTQLDALFAAGAISLPPRRPNPTLEALVERGLAHEAAFVEHLRARGASVRDLRAKPGDGVPAATDDVLDDALRSGADVIVQAPLRSSAWNGIADLLLRVDEPSDLGGYSYRVADTKLARDTTAGTVLQLAIYTELLAERQGLHAREMLVIKPGRGDEPFVEEAYRFDDFAAYVRLVRRQLETALSREPRPGTYPDPVAHCEVCRWWARCDAQRRDDDHLSLVAGIHKHHVAELHTHGITTLEGWGDADAALPAPPQRGEAATYDRLHRQARIQLRGRREQAPVHERLDAEPGRGLALLPEPSWGDVFFDFEGDPFAGDGGLEYLFGYATRAGSNAPLDYHATWARTYAEEKRAFEAFIDFAIARRDDDPGMHIYHFGHYEPSAFKRLVGRYATREAELDELLRGERFIDLHAVSRQGVRCSVERYSLKELERFAGFTRELDLRDATASLRRVECALETGAPNAIDERDAASVQAYNREDCLATAALRDWLEARRDDALREGQAIPRPTVPEEAPSEKVTERVRRIEAAAAPLLAQLPEDPSQDDDAARPIRLLTNLLGYFVREQKCAYWEYFRLKHADLDVLRSERKAIVDLTFLGEQDGGKPNTPIHRYSFAPQEVSVDYADKLECPTPVGADAIRVGSVHAVDLARGTIDIKKTKKEKDTHPVAVFVEKSISPEPLEASLLELAHTVAAHGLDGDGPARAARDLLLRRRPRFTDHVDDAAPLRRDGEPLLDATKRLTRTLDQSYLAVQGPPGSGKSFCGARAIVALALAGKRVGVTAVGHRVIRGLLEKVVAAAADDGQPVQAAHVPSSSDRTDKDTLPDGLTLQKNKQKALDALDDRTVIGGTAWFWTGNHAKDRLPVLDYLFIDEAGQMSLAMVLAVSRAAKNVVLLGDPQQLEQPQRGAHPDGADVAGLDHVIGRTGTIAPTAGLLLDETRRLPAPICTFTSALYYNGLLSSHEPTTASRVIGGDTPFAGQGLFLVDVPHEGNQAGSPEEVDVIERLVADLTNGEVTWTDGTNEPRTLTPDDILVVAPYNAQVGALRARLPAPDRVGTVDKFQGGEAPVVIYSMTSSSPEDAPRGLDFLYSPNRLNVATSRAQSICILVANPGLFEPDCRTPEQMRRANGLCLYREMATVVALNARP